MSEAQPPSVFVLLEDARDLPLIALGKRLGEVVAISSRAHADGEAGGGPLLDAARAHGAARAVRVVDVVLGGVDYLAVAHVLACAVRHLCEARPGAPVIVLAGDRGRGAVGPAVAERLAVPHLGAVREVALDAGRLTVGRICGAELRRYVGSPPVVLACALGGVVLEAPASAPASTPPETLTLDVLQITAPELEYRQRFLPAGGPVPRPRPHLVANIEVLGDRLLRDGLWPVSPSGDKP